jgi:DNA primase
MAAKASSPATEIEVGERDVRVTNPDRVYFPARGETKLDLVNYYLSVGDGIVNALRERPCMMHRFPEGVAGEKVHQKRVPHGAPPWLETVRVTFPRYNRTADELCVTELAHVIWAVQMSTVECSKPLPDKQVVRGPIMLNKFGPDEWAVCNPYRRRVQALNYEIAKYRRVTC